MKIRHYLFIFSFVVLILSLSCDLSTNIKKEEDFKKISRGNIYNGSGEEVFHVSSSGNVKMTYTLDLSHAAGLREVYFILTNTSSANTDSAPTITSKIIIGQGDRATTRGRPSINANIKSKGPIALRGKPEITDFNERSFKFTSNNPEIDGGINANLSRSRDLTGDPNTFYYDSLSSTIPSKCRRIINDNNGITLNIYVANDCWTVGGSKTYLVTQTMVDELANRFLKNDTTNDIYEWITNIFGEEWETSPYSNQIADNDEITILLYDIDGDNVPSGSFVMGFYWSKDNFKSNGDYSIPYSNQRIMFYLDAVMYANHKNYDGSPGNGSWDVTDYWPGEMISTLAHEFQHMIHYYQKAIKSGNGGYNSETWINEMCSMAAEDLVAEKLEVNGPRGVDYTIGGAGPANNENGRLPLYNTYNYLSLKDWLSGSNVLISYSINYSFGAYLARNFGGAEFFRRMVYYDSSTNINPYRDYRSINFALSNGGYSDTFNSTLRRWGAAVLLSDIIDPTGDRYRYNASNWITNILNDIPYDLGSINLYNYKYNSQIGPYIFTNTASFPSRLYGTSNLFYDAGEGSDLSADNYTWKIKMEKNVYLTVVIKEP